MRSTSRTFLYALIVVVLSLSLSAAQCGSGIGSSSSGSSSSGGDNGGADQTSKGWRVWVRTEPCSGRFDWLSVAKEQTGAGTGSGKNSYVPYDTVMGNQGCTETAPYGCTFAEAKVLMEKLRGDRKFFNYCCRDYSVWVNDESRVRSVVAGKFSTGGYGWSLVKGDLCCEEAEELAGTPGACSSNTVTQAGFIGCYKDTNSPYDLDGYLEHGENNTPERCMATCREKGFKYAGVQYGQSCLCGNSYGKYGKADNCDFRCTGDSTKICGGFYANSVYATGIGGN